MTAVIVCPNGFGIKLCGVRFTELAAKKLKSEGISGISFSHDRAEEIKSEFKKAKDFPVILFPVNVLTKEDVSVFENERADITAISGRVFAVNILPENFSSLDDLLSSAKKEKLTIKEKNAEKYFLAVNSREDYLKAQRDILSGKFTPQAKISSCALKGARYADKNIFFGKNTVISENVMISDGSYIGDNVYIGADSVIRSSAVMDNAFISSGVILENSIVYENASVGCGRKISCKTVGNGSEKNRDIFKRKVFGTDGRLSGVNPSEAYSMGKILAGKNVCAAYSSVSEELFTAFADGVRDAEGKVINLGEISENVFRIFMRKEPADFGVYFAESHIRPWSADGLFSDESLRRKLEEGINSSDGGYFGSGEKISLPPKNIREKYLMQLFNIFRSERAGEFFADISCSDEFLSGLCREFAEENHLLDREKPRIAFHISSDGARISAYTDETGYVFHEKLVMLCMLHSQNKISLPSDFPSAAEKLAAIERFDIAPNYEKMSEEEETRDKNARFHADMRLFDAPSVMALVLEMLCKKNTTLLNAVRELPVYSFSGRMIPLRTAPSDIFRRMGLPESGGKLYAERGKAFVRPMRTGGIILSAESASMEISAEICAFYEEKFKAMDE